MWYRPQTRTPSLKIVSETNNELKFGYDSHRGSSSQHKVPGCSTLAGFHGPEHSKNRPLKGKGTFAVMKNKFRVPDREFVFTLDPVT